MGVLSCRRGAVFLFCTSRNDHQVSIRQSSLASSHDARTDTSRFLSIDSITNRNVRSGQKARGSGSDASTLADQSLAEAMQ